MFTRAQRSGIAIVCLAAMAVSPLSAREGGGFRGGGGGGGGGRPGGGPAPHAGPGPGGGGGGGSAPHPTGGGAPHGGSAPHSAPVPHGAPAPHGGPGPHGGPAPHGVGIHGGEPMHGGYGGNHFAGPGHGGPGGHFVGNIHQPGPHWNNYHQAFIGGHPVHLAWAGYRPSYYYHPWYHGPWGGPAWGWGWGFGPGLTFGLAAGVGFGVGVGVGAGWGYPAYYGPYGPYGYWGRPLGWGFGGWGLGTTVYYSGYAPYYNPYYIVPVGYYPVGTTIVYDYSRPIAVAVQAPPGQPTGTLPGAPPPSNLYDGSSPTVTTNNVDPKFDSPAFDMARDSFKRGDYRAALNDVDSAIKTTRSDAVMHEFRSLTLFAMGDYRQAAAVAHSLLAVGPGWDYTTMMSLYPDPFVYSEQLQRLEAYVAEHPRAADAHFLLAYHDMIGSRKEAAVTELQHVVRLMPSDKLAGELLMMVKGPKSSTPNPTPGSPPDGLPGDPNAVPASPSGIADSSTPAADLPAVDKTQLVGSWSASRDDGSKFRLTMTEDGNFNWKYSAPNQNPVDFSGTYSLDGPVLVLQRKEGGALAGTAKFSGENDLNFKLVGSPAEDHGLDFGRF